MANATFIPPMLPTLVDDPPTGTQWLHEIKHDGYRTQLHLSPSGCRAFTRNGHDWSHLYRPVLRAAERLASDAILDGEIIVQDEQGRADFDSLKGAIATQPERLIFYAFDLLALGGQDLRGEPLIQRRVLLSKLVGKHDPERCIQVSEAVVGGGPEFFDHVCSMELEGIVSKKANSRYRSGRTKLWLKTKAFIESEFVVVGWEHNRKGPAVALLAWLHGEFLEYAGSAFITLAEPDRTKFWDEMERLSRITAAVSVPITGANWVTPALSVRAKHLRCSGKLRHATLCGVVGS